MTDEPIDPDLIIWASTETPRQLAIRLAGMAPGVRRTQLKRLVFAKLYGGVDDFSVDETPRELPPVTISFRLFTWMTGVVSYCSTDLYKKVAAEMEVGGADELPLINEINEKLAWIKEVRKEMGL